MRSRTLVRWPLTIAVLLGTCFGSVVSAQQMFKSPLLTKSSLLAASNEPDDDLPALSNVRRTLVQPEPGLKSAPTTPTFSAPPANGPIQNERPIDYEVPSLSTPNQQSPALPVAPGSLNPQSLTPQSIFGTAPAETSGTCPGGADCPLNYSCRRFSLSPREAARQSLCGDVYAPGAWRPLDMDDFFEDGWDEAWAGGPSGGEGLTPRHGWLGATDGVLYRLWLNTFTYQSGVPIGNGLTSNNYASTFSIFLPFNRRFEVLIDSLYLVSNSTSSIVGGMPTANTNTQFGDTIITPRFLLQESTRVSQVLAMGIQTPTGQGQTGFGNTALQPRYEFWTNPTGGWVARGGLGVFVPVGEHRTTTSMTGNIAIGRYLTSHDAPLGDLVLYGSTNFVSSFDTNGKTLVSIGPGTRFHVGNNWFVLGFANFFLSSPMPNNYLTQVALMKVF